jgi:hypothetical protein
VGPPSRTLSCSLHVLMFARYTTTHGPVDRVETGFSLAFRISSLFTIHCDTTYGCSTVVRYELARGDLRRPCGLDDDP